MDVRVVSLFRLRRAAVFAFLFCLVAWPAGRAQAASLNDLPPSLQTKVLSGDLPPEILEKLGQSPHQDFKSETIEKSSAPPPATSPSGKLSVDQNDFQSAKQEQQPEKPSKIELQYRQSYGLAAPAELTAPDQINMGQNSPGPTSLSGSGYGQTAPTGTVQGNGPGQQQSIQSSGPVLTDELCQYGYDIFSTANPKPSMLAVPDGGYILGPGDRLRIRIWGSDEDAEFTGTIDRDGTINVPKIGIVPIAGVKFSDAEGIIKREAEKYIQGINVNVSLEELRSLEIYVVGSVANPGLHLVPAFSTVLDALVASGGIPKTGSLRKIELYRGQKLLRSIDLYDLLLKGNRKADIVLENRDVIFVPRLRKTAAVVGSVAEEGIFELNGEKTVGDLLALSGGLLPQADSGRIYLRRYLDNRKFAIQDIDTARTKDWQKIPIRDGDLLELRSVQMKMPQT
ncbi:MAG: polysaccharide export protein, partial [Deltaproteobacteria bacterium]